MNLNRHNVQTSGLLETVGRMNRQLPKAAYIKAAYSRQVGADWQFAVARCVLTPDPLPDRAEIYRESAFITKAITEFSLNAFLDELTTNGYTVSDGFPPIKVTATHPNWREEVIPSHITKTFPVRRYSITASANPLFIETQMIAYDMPFEPSAQKYLNQFIGLNGSDNNKGELLIEIEDRRGRIKLEQNELSIADSMADLCIVGQINEDTRLLLKGTDSATVNDDDIKHIDLWMVTPENEIVDYWSSSEWQYKFRTRRDTPAIEDILDEVIRRGEDESCEFKQYIDLTSNQNTKTLQVENTVCALSNTKGGRLFIGVDDEGEIRGVENEIRKAFACDVAEAGRNYIKSLQKRLRETLRDAQCFSIDAVEIRSKFVIVITVQKSAELNFLLDSKLAYIRRGAT